LGSGSVTPLILNLGTSWGVVSSRGIIDSSWNMSVDAAQRWGRYVKVKVRPITGPEGPRGRSGSVAPPVREPRHEEGMGWVAPRGRYVG
jgi:hypothetical protein